MKTIVKCDSTNHAIVIGNGYWNDDRNRIEKYMITIIMDVRIVIVRMFDEDGMMIVERLLRIDDKNDSKKIERYMEEALKS